MINNFRKTYSLKFKKIIYLIVPFRYRYEKTFRKHFNCIVKTAKEDVNLRADLQIMALKKLLIHSHETVPYYKKLFNEIGFKPEKFNSLEELNMIPFLTKEIINNNFEELQSEAFTNKKKYEISTSGSTGKKLRLLVTDEVFKKEAAFILNTYKSHGATLYDKPSVWLRRYVPKNSDEDLFKYDFELKRMYLSAYHLNDNNIRYYFKLINSRKYHTIVGYPSSIYLLALLAERFDLKFKFIKSIHVASEMMLPMWRNKIIEVFGIIPYAHYGQMEKVVLMHQQDPSGFYFNNFEYGYTELIEKGEHFEIVGTGFINFAMPLIRYRTNDLAIEPKFEKGKLIGVNSIIGRNDDFLTTYEGHRIPGVNFYSWVNKDLPQVSLFQIIQSIDKKIIFRYVSQTRNTMPFERKIEEGLRARLGEVKIEIEQVESIVRDSNTNKLRAIISEVQ